MGLTKEDFESLGWNLDIVITDDNFKKYAKDNYVLGHSNSLNTISIIVADLSKNEQYLKYYNEPCVRNITINTKDELKVLMRQLNIE